MSENKNLLTPASLISRMRNPALSKTKRDAAWNVFLDRYGRLIFSWLSQRGVTPSHPNHDEIVQELLVKLFLKLSTYKRGQGSFTSWLYVITRRIIKDVFRKEKRKKWFLERYRHFLERAAASELAEGIAQGHDKDVLALACQQAKRDSSEKEWLAFHLTTFENMKAADVAQKLGISISIIYVYRSRVKKLIQQHADLIKASDDLL